MVWVARTKASRDPRLWLQSARERIEPPNREPCFFWSTFSHHHRLICCALLTHRVLWVIQPRLSKTFFDFSNSSNPFDNRFSIKMTTGTEAKDQMAALAQEREVAKIQMSERVAQMDNEHPEANIKAKGNWWTPSIDFGFDVKVKLSVTNSVLKPRS